jgi:indolepyruvate ferredoxin oxidoreductase
VPVETEFGRKRAIDQSTCNKDYACVTGFCPSILTVHGGQLRRGKALAVADNAFDALPEPALPSLEKPVGLLVAGVGGTGVVTIGALIGMAAHLEGKGVTVLDMTGLAQKGGAVMSHVRLAERQEQLHAPRLATGEADTLLGCDIVVAVGNDVLVKMQTGRTRAIVNTGKAITGDFVRNPDHPFPLATMEGQIRDAVGEGQADLLDASRLATLLLGHSIGTNMFMLGYAWQKGRVPLSLDALMRAIELNGVAIADNQAAFLWGRRTAHDPAAVERLVAEAEPVLPTHVLSQNLDDIIARRRAALTDYQDTAYAQRYAALVERVRTAESALAPGSTQLAEAVARNYFKLLAYKDEYEVARLYSDPEFERTLAATFEGDTRLRFHLAIPLFSRTDPNTGLPKKFAYGSWMRMAMKPLAKLKFLRGTAFDVFGRSEERRLERELIGEYEKTVETLVAGLRADNLATAAEIARLPETIRGFGPIKQRNAAAAGAKRKELLARYSQSPRDAAHAVAA